MHALLTQHSASGNEEQLSSLVNEDNSNMPDSWSFPGFIVFALMGPIVPPSLLHHRSDLLMITPSTSLCTQASAIMMDSSAIGGNASVGGQNAARKAATKEATRNRKNDKCSTVVGTAASSTGDNRGYTINQRIRVAGIAQSKALVTIMGNRERGRLGAQIVRMREKRVIRHEALIEAKKFLILNTDINDPKQNEHVKELNDLHITLTHLITELSAAEETALEDASSTRMELDSAATMASDNFIDLTMKDMITLDHGDEDGKVAATCAASRVGKRQRVLEVERLEEEDQQGNANDSVSFITEPSVLGSSPE